MDMRKFGKRLWAWREARGGWGVRSERPGPVRSAPAPEAMGSARLPLAELLAVPAWLDKRAGRGTPIVPEDAA